MWRRVFSERLPSFQNGAVLTFHVNQDGKVRYEDLYRKNNPISMVMPRIYRINAERSEPFAERPSDVPAGGRASKAAIRQLYFERAKKCNHCFSIGLINKKPEELSAFETARLLEFKIYQMNLMIFRKGQ